MLNNVHGHIKVYLKGKKIFPMVPAVEQWLSAKIVKIRVKDRWMHISYIWDVLLQNTKITLFKHAKITQCRLDCFTDLHRPNKVFSTLVFRLIRIALDV